MTCITLLLRHLRMYLSTHTTMENIHDAKYNSLHHYTCVFNLELCAHARYIHIMERVLEVERVDLIVERGRCKHDLLYLKQEQEKVHVSGLLISLTIPLSHFF